MFCRRCLIWASSRWIGESEGPRYAEKILAYLEQRYMPDLRSAIVTQRLFTPEDFRVGA